MFWNNSRTFYNYLKRSTRLSPSSRSRNRFCRRTVTSTHFWSSRNTTLHTETTLKTALELLDLDTAQDSKPSANNNTRYSLAKSITGCIKFTKRAESSIDFWQLQDVFESPDHINELMVWKTDSRFFFSRLTPIGRVRNSSIPWPWLYLLSYGLVALSDHLRTFAWYTG